MTTEKETLEIEMQKNVTIGFVQYDKEDKRILLDVTPETNIALKDKLGFSRTGTFTVKELFEAAEEKRALNSPTCASEKRRKK